MMMKILNSITLEINLYFLLTAYPGLVSQILDPAKCSESMLTLFHSSAFGQDRVKLSRCLCVCILPNECLVDLICSFLIFIVIMAE